MDQTDEPREVVPEPPLPAAGEQPPPASPADAGSAEGAGDARLDLNMVGPVEAEPVPAPPPGPVAVAEPVPAEAAAGPPAQALAEERRDLPPLDSAGIQPPRRGPGWLGVVAVALASALLGACLALVILAAINGTLQFGRATALRRTMSAVQDLNLRVDRVTADLSQMQAGLDRGQADLEAMGQQLRDMRRQLDTLDQNVTAAQTELNGMRTNLGRMGESMGGLERRAVAVETQLAGAVEQVRTMRAAVERFDVFLAGLRSLLDQARPPGSLLEPRGTPLTPLPGRVTPGPTPLPTGAP